MSKSGPAPPSTTGGVTRRASGTLDVLWPQPVPGAPEEIGVPGR
jgi:hypothetical protein